MNLSKWLRFVIASALVVLVLGERPTSVTQAGMLEHQRASSTLSLGSFLKLDGTLDLTSGFNGSLDARGWRLTTTADGTPRFVAGPDAPHKPDIAGDEWWSSEFQIGVSDPGYAAHVYAIAIQGNDIYIGGSFSRAGGIDANDIVRFNTVTQHWSSLGAGIPGGAVYVILINGPAVYVGGSFNDAGGVSVGGLTRWDTVSQTWSAVGGLLTSGNFQFAGTVNALALDGSGNLIVGGYFNHAGMLPIMNIARWNGTAWSAIGGGIGTSNGTDEVYALVASGNDIYAGGSFANPASNLAHWNGSTWLSDTGGTNGIVRALFLNGNALYVGGDFTQVGLVSANRIAVWNGTNWSALGTGTDNTVRSIALGSNGLYIGGLFTQADGNLADYVARWTGSAWVRVSTVLDGEVDALAVSGSDVYAGGDFSHNESGVANHLARWNVVDSAWYTLGNSPNDAINAVAIDGSDVYVGGHFNSIAGLSVSNLAKWNSQTGMWSDVGGGVMLCTGPLCITRVYAIAVNGTSVYVGGDFTYAGAFPQATSVNNLARWDTITQKWSPGNVTGCTVTNCETDVFAIVPDGSGVDVGGYFTTACTSTCITVNNVVYWDGNTTYRALTDGVATGVNGPVSALLNDGYGLYIGGQFTSPRTNLAYFDGTDWYGPGSPLGVFISALAEDDKYLYAGGMFTNAGGHVGANNIARLSLTSAVDWQPVGGGFDDVVLSLAWNGHDLIAGGLFTQNGLTGLNHIARWNTTTETWSLLGSEANGIVTGLAANDSEIFASGRFTQMGGKESDHLARWAHYQIFLPEIVR